MLDSSTMVSWSLMPDSATIILPLSLKTILMIRYLTIIKYNKLGIQSYFMI